MPTDFTAVPTFSLHQKKGAVISTLRAFIYLVCNIINRWLLGDQGALKGNETGLCETCSFESVQAPIKVCLIISCKSWCSQPESFNLRIPFLTYYISKTVKAGLMCYRITLKSASRKSHSFLKINVEAHYQLILPGLTQSLKRTRGRKPGPSVKASGFLQVEPCLGFLVSGSAETPFMIS